MNGNLKAFLTISISLCESYDGFDTSVGSTTTPTSSAYEITMIITDKEILFESCMCIPIMISCQ